MNNKKRLFTIKPSIVVIWLVSLTALYTSYDLSWGGDKWQRIVQTDGHGYYAYLPAIFIHKDLHYGFYDDLLKEKYENALPFYYRLTYNDSTINKYYFGTALAESPFFLVAHALAEPLGFAPDGYSKPYMIAVSLAAIFYLFLGLWLINKALKTYQLGEWTRAWTLIAMGLGTHLFYYSTKEPSMSHVYSFAFVSMLIYSSRMYFNTLKFPFLLLMSLALGMIGLIRPVNGLFILSIPLLAGSFSTLLYGISRMFSFGVKLLVPLVLFVAITFIQPLLYKISCGQFFVYTYIGEGFDFANPHFIDILFSYKKGLFLYTPMLLLSLVGLYFLWKRNRFAAFNWLAFFILLTYVFSSWKKWYYGGSFSGRVFIEVIPYFAILTAIAIQGFRSKWLRTAYLSLIVLLTLVCQDMTVQYQKGQIHWEDMDKARYKNTIRRLGGR